jgi:hypothetical protein
MYVHNLLFNGIMGLQLTKITVRLKKHARF